MTKILRFGDSGFSEKWDQLWYSVDSRYPLYSSASMAYYREYSGVQGWDDISFVICQGDLPVYGVLMALHKDGSGKNNVSAFGMPVYAIARPELEMTRRGREHKLLKAEIERILCELAPARVLFQDYFVCQLSDLGDILLQNGGVASPLFTQVVDLTVGEEMLRQGLTKSYKWCVNWGLKHLNLTVLDSNSMKMEDMESFRQLHIEVAGRETRSLQSWALQYEMVRRGEAFAVYGTIAGELVTAALFVYSPTYCFYGVSASKRTTQDKLLSHGVLWKAMLHASSLGITQFETGRQDYPRQGDPVPTSKELGISSFKRGFGGDTFVYLSIVLDVPADHSFSVAVA
ncbi:MAG: hypothetical protein HW380_3784 [Magnetococcales bacterium]|nr:hypothetical protein [Magnetococcales bacterium]